jgi:hypothetical protein
VDTTVFIADPNSSDLASISEKKISSRHSHRKKFIAQKCMIDPVHVHDILGVKKSAQALPTVPDTITTTTTTTTSNNNLQDYFAKKMAEKGLLLFNGILSVSKSVKIDKEQEFETRKRKADEMEDINVNDDIDDQDKLEDLKRKEKELKRSAKRAAKDEKRAAKDEKRRAKELKRAAKDLKRVAILTS